MRLPRLLPGSLAGQFALLLVAALLFANVAAVVLFGSERQRLVREVRRGADVERIAQIARVLAEVPPGLRDDVAAAASSRLLRLEVSERPAVRESGRDRLSILIRRVMHEALGQEDARVRVVGERAGWGDHHHRRSFGRRFAVRASVPLADGAWLNVRQRPPPRPPGGPGAALVVTLVLSLVSVLGVGLIFIRRITRPIRALSDAADRAGSGDRTARVPVGGAGEVRRAAEAFNTMQEKIAAFDAERARTVAAVGHDLRTPITSLRIRAEMLDEETRAAMVRTLDEMRVMADGLLEWGRSGAEREATETVDLAALLGALCDEAVRYEGPAALPVSGRPVALSRAFGNLVENARRYAGSGVVRLADEGETARIVVADRGPGIPQERLGAMLDPFTRLEASRSAETGGAGLGLSIARDIINAHGGTIALANRPAAEGGGLAVTVSLPRRR